MLRLRENRYKIHLQNQKHLRKGNENNDISTGRR